ncbi:OmpA family protein [Vallicoccus soli]|uniref:OmpA family protein n=1 Tax=Vallicoccus soli TaxID=2339232 RepID=A0A3A3YZF3_9ACTN|nr:OmpA family protein [Vallicoccus soli]
MRTQDADRDALAVRPRPAPGTVAAVEDGRLVVAAATGTSGRLTTTVVVDDRHGGTATRELRLTVLPRPAAAVGAGVLRDPGAEEALRRPVYEDGVPVSRLLSARTDSEVVWRSSATASVSEHLVHVDGRQVCRVPAGAPGERTGCTVRGRALLPAQRVQVRAVGVDGTVAAPVDVPVRPAAASRRLVAVVYFPTGEFYLDEHARATLRGVVEQAAGAGFTAVRMEGHTDADGSSASNDVLSRQRARQVRDWLLPRAEGLEVSGTAGFGEDRPAATNATRAGKAANRRVEVYVG